MNHTSELSENKSDENKESESLFYRNTEFDIYIFDVMYCSLSCFSNILIEDSIYPLVDQFEMINKPYAFRIDYINTVINILNEFKYMSDIVNGHDVAIKFKKKQWTLLK